MMRVLFFLRIKWGFYHLSFCCTAFNIRNPFFSKIKHIAFVSVKKFDKTDSSKPGNDDVGDGRG